MANQLLQTKFAADDIYDNKGLCDALETYFTLDVCGPLRPNLVDFSTSTDVVQRSPTACRDFNYDDPDTYESVSDLTETALSSRDNMYACFSCFNAYCQYAYGSQQERLEAFGNWTVTYAGLYNYINGTDAQLVGPDCFFSIYPL